MQIPRFLLGVFLVIAFIGFLDASYLTASHYSGVVPPCFVTRGCDTVTTSSYSKVLGIPISLLGALYYLSIIILSLLYIDKKKEWIIGKALPIITGGSFLVSMGLLYVQAEILKAFCSYCLVSAITSTLLFIFALIMRRKLIREEV